MATFGIFPLSLVVFVLVFKEGIMDSSFPCDDTSKPTESKPMPTLPFDAFQTELEIVTLDSSSKIQDRYMSVEFYDFRKEKFGVSVKDKEIFLDYKAKQVISKDADNCIVEPLTEDTMNQGLSEIFPEISKNLSISRIFSPLELMGINSTVLQKTGYTYLGTTTVRNITSDSWKICVNQNESILVYWSVDQWETPAWNKTVPLSFEIIKRNGTRELINMVDFIPNYQYPFAMEIPPGQQCFGISSVPFPSIRVDRGIHFTTETVSASSHQISYTENFFDLQNQLGKTIIEIPATKVGKASKITAVIDFNFNLTFINNGESCRIEEFSSSLLKENEIANLHFMYVSSHQNFFGVNADNVVYLGQRYARNIPCVVWQTTRTDWPLSNAGVTSIWEWVFTDWAYEDKGIEGSTGFMMPFHLQVHIAESNYSLLPAKSRLQYNIYNFYENTEDDIDVKQYDISDCFENPLHLRFEVDVQDKEHGKNFNMRNSRKELYLWRMLIARGANVPLLRISKVKAVVLDEKLYIQFILLGQINNFANKGNYATTIKDAKEFLQKATADGSMKIFTEQIQLIAKKDSLTEEELTCKPVPATSHPGESTTTKKPSTNQETTIVPDDHSTPKISEDKKEGQELKKAKFSGGSTAGISIGSFVGGLSAGMLGVYAFKVRQASR